MAGQRCSSSEFQGFSVPAAAAAVRAWAASASQQFSVSAFERCCCPGVGACPASAPQQFRVSEFQRLRVAAAAAAGRGWAALQQFRVSEFQRLSVASAAAAGRGWAALQQFSVSEIKRLSVAAAAAAGRGWAALQQFRVSGLQRSRCGGRGACLGSVSVAALRLGSVQQFQSAFKRSRLRRRRCVAGQRCSSSEFQSLSVSSCCGGGAWLGSVAAVQSFRVSAFPLRRPRCVPGQRQRRSSSVFQRLSVAAAAAAVRGWAALQQFRVSEFQRLSVAAAAAAGRGWAALQQFRVSGFSVPAAAAAVRAWAASASQQFSVSAFERCCCPVSVRGWAALQQFRVSAFKRSSCCGGGAWLGSVAAVQSFRASAFPLLRPRCVPGQRQRRSSSVFQRLSVAAALVSEPAQRQRRSSSEFQSFSG